MFKYNSFINLMLENVKQRQSQYLLKCSCKPFSIDSRQEELMRRSLPKQKPIEGVKNIVVVSSGKGGVGKSTTAVNLAVALTLVEPNKKVGLLDTDIFGPTVPLMMNLHHPPLITKSKLMEPLINYGVKCMSFGFLIEEGAPIIWRGLMVMQALEKLMRQVHWEDIDYLIVDTPPGTGDTHLSLIQNIPINGVVLVTTPHTAALQVTRRGTIMYKKLNIPIIGLVENMSTIKCPSCSSSISIFGDGAKKLCEELDLNILERFPLKNSVSEGGDNGIPVVLDENNDQSILYKNLAKRVTNFLRKVNK
ncbi:hypothetical protein ABEB36_004113 [Hypothenemus hampei]|uniref:Iron-sulfur protein NUBPL n=1 Tax=Hypothenemus hampei TaxID=57062 RepID=A0ABD1F2K3_HYPHA